MLRKNLEWLMRRDGLNAHSLAREAKANQPTLFRILSGESLDPRTATLRPLADFFGVSVEDLRGLDLEQHPEAFTRAGNVKTPEPRPIKAWSAEDELDGDYVTLPRLDMKGSCGGGNVVWSIDEKGQPQAFRRSWCERLGIDTDHSATIVAEGDSMADRIQDGDSLVVDPTKRQLMDGRVYLIFYDGEYFVKRIFKVPGVGLRIVSDNPDKTRYPDWHIPLDKADSLVVVGRVMGISGGI